MKTLTQSIKHLSTKPWSDFTAADYSIQQWHNACLIHLHNGPPMSKNECKLPVKTPDGAVNQNGVHAAAAALAGARGGLNAPPAQKATAAKALIKLYQSMNEKPPPSLMAHSSIEEFLEHHGVKGMRWGVRNATATIGRGINKTEAFVKRHKKGIVTVGVVGAAAIGAAFMAKNINTKKRIASFRSMDERIREIQHELNFSRNLKSPFREGLKNQLQTLKEQQLRETIGEKYFKNIVAGPIGSTGVSRLSGAIPLPKVGH
jgi:hypothetical protein